jgi:hypothetical protein
MKLTTILHHDYPGKMMPLICHHYNEGSKNVISENITHYLCVIMFGCYNVETKNVIKYLASRGVIFDTQARSREPHCT